VRAPFGSPPARQLCRCWDAGAGYRPGARDVLEAGIYVKHTLTIDLNIPEQIELFSSHNLSVFSCDTSFTRWLLRFFATAGVAAAQPTPGDWTGVYVGGTVGVAFNQTHFSLPGDPNDRLLQNSSNDTAFSGGGLIGFNYQMNDVVVGVEGDITTGQSTAKVTDCAVPDGCFVNTHDSFTTYNSLKGGATERARVRLGWAQGPNLFYVAGGYSAQQTNLNLLGDCFNPGNPNVPLVFTFSRAKTVSGFNVGAGVEHAIDRHRIGRVEYIYDGFGDQTYAGDGAEWNNRRLSISDNTVRAAIGYKF
jgi:outer membrane immunogenic protein